MIYLNKHPLVNLTLAALMLVLPHFAAHAANLEIQTQGSQRILTDDLIRRLAKMGEQVKQVFKGVNQDIEWAVEGNQIILLQARPY